MYSILQLAQYILCNIYYKVLYSSLCIYIDNKAPAVVSIYVCLEHY